MFNFFGREKRKDTICNGKKCRYCKKEIIFIDGIKCDSETTEIITLNKSVEIGHKIHTCIIDGGN